MFSLFSRQLATWLFVLAIACPLAAQETTPSSDEPTSEELTYFDLRLSKDRATKQFADRYFNLVKTQEWISANGKSKVMAKYVAHDPNLTWVKLSTVRGTGNNRKAREVTVEVAKLNKTCQSRVKQISVLQAKLDELAVAEKERESEADDESRGTYGESNGRGEEMAGERTGRAGRYGEAESPSAEPVSETMEQRAGGAVSSEAVVPDGSDDPDPLGFADLANELAAAPTGENPGLTGGGRAAIYGASSEAPPDAVPADGGRAAIYGRASDAGSDGGSIDRTQWQTNYAAFRANIMTSQGAGDALIVDWGELADLRQMNELAEASIRNRSDPSRSGSSEIADRIGEVQWEAPFTGVGETIEGRKEILFDLPPVSQPLNVRFFVDEREIDPWMALRPGTPVRFAGRFDIRQPLEIQVIVRKLD
jgi:hypothetical protein